MINKRILISVGLLGCAASFAAGQPGLLSKGSTTAFDGWRLDYSAVARPPLLPGEHVRIQTDATHTDLPGQPDVFHRFFTDASSKTYFGYDLVVQPAESDVATVRFQPLSLRGNQLPPEYGAADYRTAAIPRFATTTFPTGQTIAVDVLENRGNGQKVVDYIQVSLAQAHTATHRAAGQSKAAPVSVTVASAAEIEKAKSLGTPIAAVRLEVFSDFECPACKAFHDTVMPLLMKEYVAPGKLYVINHEFPLPMHQYSREAANEATAAAQVGKYQQVADALFANQNTWGTSGKVWDTVAAVLTPAEQAKVQALMKQPGIAALVQQDVDLGMAQKLNQTPTVFVTRGQKTYAFPGPTLGNYGFLKSLIDDLLK